MLINANALSIPIAANSVHTIVTSPPYYGLRDYGTAKWEGGDPNCDHNPQRPDGGARADRSLPLGRGGMFREVCSKCGAIRIDEQIGLEQTPDEYIANLVDVFRECKRILRDDGTLWVNIGDSYAGGGKKGDTEGKKQKTNRGATWGSNDTIALLKSNLPGIKSKDLIGIPWMLAFALRADGWYLRQDIIWAKPNPMPESVKDRCTKSHEYIFLLSKSARYYYDADAINEPVENMGKPRAFSKPGNGDRNDVGRMYEPQSTRNKRDVWTVTTKPYKGAHYATFNPDLIKPCILAGAPDGGIVFDPFVGSGTTVATAIQLGRKGIGVDLSFKYLQENAKPRVDEQRLPLLEIAEAPSDQRA